MAPPKSVPDLTNNRLEFVLEAAGLGEFEWRLKPGILYISERMAAITGGPSGEFSAPGDGSLIAQVPEADRKPLTDAIEYAASGDGRYDLEYCRTHPADGRVQWLRVVGVVSQDAAGQPTAVNGFVQDVTARALEDESRRTLMAELDHRVKNVLSAVQTLAIQTSKRTTSLDSFMATFAGRLKSMAAANELLTAARWRGASVAHLAAAELGGIAPGQTRWEGPELFLTPRGANALALALHELATNALKFGALSVESGRVEVNWTRLADGGVELIWIETGGPSVSEPVHRGFGSTLLDQVTGRELNGTVKVDYRSGGLRVRLRAGASALVERPDEVPEGPRFVPMDLAPVASGPIDLKGARVLIVEDAVLLALELDTGLTEAGALVVGPAYELAEAQALLDQPIDAAVLDANLNGHSVLPVAEILARRGIPFVFATGYGDNGGAPGGFNAPVIRKPYDVTQVAAAVAGLLASR